jgi:S1-C subfamily serine protease
MARFPATLRLLGPLFVLAAGSAAVGADPGETAWLGIFLGDAIDGGVQVVSVVPDGPAARAGVRKGDVVLAVAGKETEDRMVLGDAVDRFRPGETVPLRVLREGRVKDLAIEAGRSPVSFSWTVEPSPPLREFAFGGFGGPVLGMTLREIPPELRRHFGAPAEAGILVAAVTPESPGARAGLRVGDVVVRVAGKPVARSIDLSLATARVAAGRPVDVDAVRGGRPVSLRLQPSGAGARDREALEREVEERNAEIERLRLEVEALERELETSRGDAERDAP